MQARRLAFLIAVLALGLVGPAGAAPTVKVAFLQGEQMVTVNRPGSTVQEALDALIAGPTAAETKRGFRTYVPPDTAIRSATVSGDVATVDLNQAFIKGNDAASTLARLAQVVKTTTSVPGITTAKILVGGGVPLGLFPGINATVPLTPEAFATPNVAPPKPAAESGKPANDSTRSVQQQLAALGYLLPADIDGKPGPATQVAVIAFQKWQSLQRDGTAGPQTLAALARAKRPTPITRGGPGRRVEVLLDRQLVLAIQNDVVVRALHVSTGAAATPTPPGSFRIYGKYARWWSVPFRDWLLWAAPFNGGIAMHQYPDVPVYPASHGCVRVPESNAKWLYDFNSVGESVKVLTISR